MTTTKLSLEIIYFCVDSIAGISLLPRRRRKQLYHSLDYFSLTTTKIKRERELVAVRKSVIEEEEGKNARERIRRMDRNSFS